MLIETRTGMQTGCKVLMVSTHIILMLLCLCFAQTGFADDKDFRYLVKPGDNPWNLTARYLKNVNYWPRIQQYNQIDSPNTIPVGTVLRIPLAWMRADAITATVTDLRGEVLAERNGEFVALSPDSKLGPGAVVRTGADSSFTLTYPDGSRSLMGSNALLRLESLHRLRASGAQQVELGLEQGEVNSRINPVRNHGGRFLIRTPSAVAAVRGTDFRAATDSGSMRVETLEGEVVLSTRRGLTVLPAGEGSIARPDQRPEAARALLPAPTLAGLPSRIERLPFELAISPVDGAQAYRSQIAPNADFSVLSSDQRSMLPRAAGSATLPDGEYFLRVRAIDGSGLEGLNAEQRIVVDARPEPPFPSAPARHSVASEQGVRFAWANVPGAIRYHFELAREGRFYEALIEAVELTDASHYVEDRLEAGTYQWRIAVTTQEEGRGPFSDPQTFRRLETGPSADAVEVSHGKIQLRWRENPLATGYRVQVSRHAEFAEILEQRAVPEAILEFNPPSPGTYFFRIRHEEADGAVGPWGQAQSVEAPYNHWPALLLFLPLLIL